MHRIAVRAVVALLAALTVLMPSPANPAEIYKYWSYFTVDDGEFAYADTGPGQTTPTDGSIEAYRYAAPANFDKPNLPRADLQTLTFDAICGDSTADAGEKRVAVIVDFGVAQDAVGGQATPEPTAACAVAPEAATGIQVLEAAVGDVRVENQSGGPAVCGINGYPATGCFDNMADAGTPADGEPVEFAVTGADDAAPQAEEDSSSVPLLAGLGAVLALLIAGSLLLQRRRTQV